MTVTVERVPLGRPVWHCEPQAITCVNEHLLAFYEAGYRADFRNMSGHAFLQCQKCSPATFFLALFMRDPSPLVICYGLSKESYTEWDRRTEPTPGTGELLYLLRDPEGRSHNPLWRPAKPRQRGT